ncbi:MAG: glycosyltransferase family 39 protein [Acidobacteriota bacterium]
MPPAEGPALLGPRAERAAAAGFLLLAALLAVTALLADSAAFDEVIHLPAGIVQLKTGDLRFAPDHPPLARLWAALPSAFVAVVLPDPKSEAFRTGEFVAVGREVLEKNSGVPLLTMGRFMIVVLLLVLLVLVRAASRRLFGRDAGLLALAVASLSPSLLAHGHLVTTDLPAALLFLAVLVAFARLVERLSPGRLAAAALLLAALVLTKYSWPIVLPALLAMGVVAAATRSARVVSLAGVAVVCGLVAWGSVWACYGFRFSPFRGPGAAVARMHVPLQAGSSTVTSHSAAWEAVLSDSRGVAYTGPTAAFARWARRNQILPEAWIYGVMLLKKMSYPRTAYFHGAIGPGWAAYFPVAFLVKSPLPELLLGALGLLAIAARRARPKDLLLAAGLAVFAVSYGVFAVLQAMNIGERHILPLHAVLAVAAGAGAAWAGPRWGWALLVALVLWMGAEIALVHPNELGYFNETVGGSRNGSRWLADSNIDWGQDLLRLARWTKENGDPEVKLAYFGAVDPRGCVPRATNLTSAYPFGAPAPLTPGVYVASVNQLIGLFIPIARDEFWEKPGTRDWYASRWEMARASGFARPAGLLGRDVAVWDAFEAAERGRLLRALRRRAPDAWIGTSLRVYRLSQADLDAILPP